ncbi:MAG: hypothetical protein V9E81_10305 [Marmoricola sp.]
MRPQTIADFFDATFKTVRKYPGATLGFGLLVSVIAHVIPLTVVFLGDFTSSNLFDPTMSDGSGSLKFTAGDLSVVALMYTSVFISGVTSIFIGGMVANVAMSAALGEPLPLAAAWAKTRPHIWRLLGLALLTAHRDWCPSCRWLPRWRWHLRADRLRRMVHWSGTARRLGIHCRLRLPLDSIRTPGQPGHRDRGRGCHDRLQARQHV